MNIPALSTRSMSDIFSGIVGATFDGRSTVHSLVGRRNTERDRPLDQIGRSLSVPYGAQIYGEGDPVKYLYVVVSGAVRACRYSLDGRRQIVRFCLPGDTFGLEPEVYHTVSTEAINNTYVREIRQAVFYDLAAHDEEIAHHLWISVYRQLARDQEHILRLGKLAAERVSDFILELAGRIPNCGTLQLPMSRQDIADHLGLTIETVSRTITNLTRTGVIEKANGRRITIRKTRRTRSVHMQPVACSLKGA
jgi:CRP/FNR family transcriptional regulator, nitrogen fixation regulation protein